jgi:hypothetical protein
MSDTPETDAAWRELRENNRVQPLLYLANKLERERDEARKALHEIASLDTSQDASPQQCAAVLLAMNALEQ